MVVAEVAVVPRWVILFVFITLQDLGAKALTCVFSKPIGRFSSGWYRAREDSGESPVSASVWDRIEEEDSRGAYLS